MPKIFEYFGFIFYFFSNEHEPIHVKWVKFFVLKQSVRSTRINKKL